MTDYKLVTGNTLDVLKEGKDNSIQVVVTSPPYFGLRNYEEENQIGLEKTPEEYVSKLVDVFREVKRILKDNGILWLNLGDSIRNKQLLGIPWRVAFALQADNWILRSDIIWAKPAPMPESVKDRPTRSHEYIFLLTKNKKYYYDSDAIAEPLKESSIKRNQTGWDGNEERDYVQGKQNHFSKYLGSEKAKIQTTRNKRDVWIVPTRSYREAHFATFPPDLIEPCILAGSKEGDWILDPFCGSGTTGIVALKHKRRFIGIDLNPSYIDLSENRIQKEIYNANT